VTNPTKIGRYEIIDRVGRGGMGAVYRGRDTVLDREVAIKVMSADFAADEGSRPRFYREARAAAKLQHRNIVTIFEFGEEDETPFIVMEFLRGEDLSKRVRRDPPLSLDQKIDVIAELCTGLHFAHEQGVIHRDVKPANIWLVPDGSVKLLDFGIAKFASSTLTRQGSVFGSISYMSPEQVNGGEVDGRADIFSAGVVLYELLSGKKPFSGESPTAVLARIMDDQPASLADLPADLPRPLVAAVMKALEKNRERRYRHAADMGADLRMVRSALSAGEQPAAEADFAETSFTPSGSIKAGEPTGQQPAGLVTVSRTATLDLPPSPSPARGRAWFATIGAAVLLSLGVGGWFLVKERGGTAARTDTPAASAAARRPVRIDSQPRGARIAIDGVESGRETPADVDVDPARPPGVTLKLAGRLPVTTQLTAEDIAKGTMVLHLDRPAADKPAPPPASPPVATPAAPAPPPVQETKTKLVVSGDYPFEVVEGGRVVSPSAESHEVTLPSRARVYLRNQDYFLNQPVQLDARTVFEWQAPGLGRLQLTAGETCTVSIADRNLGEPPIVQVMAAGTYTAVVTCGGQPPKRETFAISPGVTSPVRVR
jgi:eukaryotic-like serine/threonine-protein kinase